MDVSALTEMSGSLRGLLVQDMVFVLLCSFDFSACGQSETFFRTAMRLHFRHNVNLLSIVFYFLTIGASIIYVILPSPVGFFSCTATS